MLVCHPYLCLHIYPTLELHVECKQWSSQRERNDPQISKGNTNQKGKKEEDWNRIGEERKQNLLIRFQLPWAIKYLQTLMVSSRSRLPSQPHPLPETATTHPDEPGLCLVPFCHSGTWIWSVWHISGGRVGARTCKRWAEHRRTSRVADDTWIDPKLRLSRPDLLPSISSHEQGTNAYQETTGAEEDA